MVATALEKLTMPFGSTATIFDYCERGRDLGFWAEPLNAATNGAFILAAVIGAIALARRPVAEEKCLPAFFILNLIAIGIGSFLFHTTPNMDTVKADTLPIGIFMLTYLGFALRRLARASWFLTAAAFAAFLGAMVIAFNIQCWDGRIGFLLENVPPGARARCLNGSVGYFPALIAMALMAAWLRLQQHPAARLIGLAALVFVISLIFRSLDRRLCGDLIVMEHRMGTHFIWHLLNASTLFLLLMAAIRHGSLRHRVLPPRPRSKQATYTVP